MTKLGIAIIVVLVAILIGFGIAVVWIMFNVIQK